MSLCIINPEKKKGESSLSRTGILAINPSDCSCLAQLAQQHHLKRQFFFNAQLYSNSSLFVGGPAVGAPMATICLEKMIALGATRIILYGWCGSLAPVLRVGDLFLPTAGLSEEGTSAHYQNPDARWDDTLQVALAGALKNCGFAPKQGPIWTTDAVFRETREKVEQYSAQEIMAVDMEYTALRTVAAFRHVLLAAVMLVSDELFHREWTPQFIHKSFRSDSKMILDKLCHLVVAGEV